jgi:subtilisin family serine protease
MQDASSSRYAALAALTVVALTGVALGTPAIATAAPSEAEAVPGELIVSFEPDATTEERRAAREEAGVRALRPLGPPDTQLVSIREGSTAAALGDLADNPDVSLVSPNWLRRPTVLPDDPFFDELWGLHNTGQSVLGVSGTPDADIDAPIAWEIQPGWGPGSENGAVVAVMDTGTDLGHPELEPRLWTNPGETPGNGLDDDLNGYVDDVHGYDFAGEDVNDPTDGDADPDDPDGHGTHVAGTVLAEGDNEEGVVGVAAGSELMALKVCALEENEEGEEEEASCPLAAMLEAYAYAIDNGARLLNASLGGPGFSAPEHALLSANPQMLFVFAAGNGGEDGIGDNNDSTPEYPCALDEGPGYLADNLICVAATTQKDGLAGFSNFGANSVDLGAPGVRTLSTYPEALTPPEFLPYAYLQGTSMATPHVSGAAALLFSALPTTSAEAAKDAILGSVDARTSLAGKTVSGGRLNVRRALETLGLEAPPLSEEEEQEEEGPGAESGGTVPPAIPLAPTTAIPITFVRPRLAPASARRTPPRTFFRRRPPKVLHSDDRRARAVFRFGSDEIDVIFLCKLDREPFGPCRRRTVRHLLSGPHALRVKARDADGNTDQTPALYRFRVKRVA